MLLWASPSALITLCRPASAALLLDSCFCYPAPDHSLCRPSFIRAVSVFLFFFLVFLFALTSRVTAFAVFAKPPSRRHLDPFTRIVCLRSAMPTPSLSCSLCFYVTLEQKSHSAMRKKQSPYSLGLSLRDPLRRLMRHGSMRAGCING